MSVRAVFLPLCVNSTDAPGCETDYYCCDGLGKPEKLEILLAFVTMFFLHEHIFTKD